MIKTIRTIFIVAAVLVLGISAYAQKSTLTSDTQHGAIGTEVCNGCHLPHGGTNGNTLLWKHSIGTSTYTVYDSATLDSKGTNITSPGNGSLNAGLASSYTLVCMSCHDGTLAAANSVTLKTSTYGTAGGAITGTAVDIGSAGAPPTGSNTLTDDHPVNMKYDPTADTTGSGLNAIASLTGVVLFDDIGGAGTAVDTVQCASCHDPHEQGAGGPGDTATGVYLRVANTAGGLCLTCHN